MPAQHRHRTASRDALVLFLNSLLNTETINDSSYNGLQVEGAAEVRKALFAVDAGIQTFEEAARRKADFVVVHHGLFWKSANPCATGIMGRRLRSLMNRDISLYASHLPLDKHPVVGNNAVLVRLVGAKPTRTFADYHGTNIGWVGTFPKPRTVDAVVKDLESRLNTRCTVLPCGPRVCTTVGVVSGGGGMGCFASATTADIDLYISGEATEVYHLARESRLNVIFAGHHATETVGVKALAAAVHRKFGIECEFVDIPTGL